MKTILIVAAAVLFARNGFAQDASKVKAMPATKTDVQQNADEAAGPATATAAEVKAKADQGATGIHELPAVREEVEREKVATANAAATVKTTKAVQKNDQSRKENVEQTADAPKKPSKPNK